MDNNQIKIRMCYEGNLKELWKVSYGTQTNRLRMKYNGPYFEDPILTWNEFCEKSEKMVNNPHYSIILYQGKIIGSLSADFEDGRLKKWLELGIILYDDKLWGRGIGKVALLEWIDQLFEYHIDIQRIGLTTWSVNEGMMRLGQKCGLRLEGRIRKVCFWQGNFSDSLKYEILREEWNKNEQLE